MSQRRGLLRATVVALALVGTGTAAAATGPALSVDAASGRHAISPYIYGWNFAPAGLAAQIQLPVDRRGGNSADTLNWQTGVENHSNDFFFENLPTCWESPGCDNTWDPSHSYTDQIERDRAVGAKTLLDLPMMGYVAGGAAAFDHPVPCSFTAAAFPAQYSFDDYDPNCGDGKKLGNSANWVTTAPQRATAVQEGASYQGQWIDDLVQRFGSAGNGGVGFYELGNEPGLWDSTHHDWHPAPTTATELRDDMLALAQQVKQHDPSAQVIGPAEWGWPNYFCSPKDGGCGPDGPNPATPGSDWTAVQHGVPLLSWILSQFKAYQDATGTRLLDYLDIHYYRQDGGTAGFDATRSLWDPSYVDGSWITDPIELIPRMRSWVEQNYPGTKLSLSEYDLAVDDMGSDAHVDQDNLTEADTLGVFAREGLDMATLWPETNESHYADAFRMFRSYDGNHSRFGDTYVSSASSDQSKLSVYGAQRSADGALTVLVINKHAGDVTSDVSLAGFNPGASAQVYRWDGVAGGIARIADQPLSAAGFTAGFPDDSMTMFVIPPFVAPPAGTAAQAAGTTTSPPAAATATPTVRCVVPKLVGLKLAQARKRLAKAHCALGRITRKKSAKPAGRIVAQKPRPRKRGKAGTKVAVVVSRGR